VGKRHLEEAMKHAPDVEFQVRWLPYQLSPHLREDSSSRVEAYMKKFNRSREQVREMAQGMKQRFAEVGLPYQTEGEPQIANTKEAHRLLTAAYKQGGPEAQDKVAEVLFNGYFGQGRAPNEPTLLEEAANAAGIDAAVVSDRNIMSAELEEELQEGRRIVSSGVPHFLFSPEGGRPVAEFAGAQPVPQMLRAIAAASK